MHDPTSLARLLAANGLPAAFVLRDDAPTSPEQDAGTVVVCDGSGNRWSKTLLLHLGELRYYSPNAVAYRPDGTATPVGAVLLALRMRPRAAQERTR
ncbi:hypothetical protein KCV87_32265 [Actinosynnema pretiosum subsp. pretiosum]|uniref:Uncharacterized protein n=1 Tax=Actinosynnema pretiosum subsp. pretiosum TaxID=103721 RepID=A0AA45R3V5_9PSEU|nr:hypothetical protein APASM_4686 [Actinosynnema pretiosum subsp. pretiosum]QUF03978.1 hypothetical protein KCV87_32265 [Actinosynnema pretiosum subsp. pretiosum]